MIRRPKLSTSLIPSLLLLAAVALPGIAAAQEGPFGTVVQLAEPPSGPVQSKQATDFTMQPSVTSSRIGAGNQTLALFVFCVDLFTGQILPNCNVVLTPQPEAMSGGHGHDDASRPKGSYQPASGNTGSGGLLSTTYTSPEVSGVIDTTITGTTAEGIPLIPTTFTIGVEVGGLASLGAGTNYDLVGATGTHGDNHYGTAGFNSSLVMLADSYAMAFPMQRLAYNDMSLVDGGLFDINATWAPPHVSHRFGVDCDVRLVAVAQRRRLRQLITAAGISTIIVEGNHWHLRQ